MIRGDDEVFKFSLIMLAKLNQAKNIGKGSWLNCKKSYLLWRLLQESCELARALVNLYFAEQRFKKNPSLRTRDMTAMARHNVAGEAADVANFAMMMADKAGGLERQTASE